MKKDSMLYTVIFTFVICAVFVFFLALANESTKDKVAENRNFAQHSAVLRALGIAYDTPDQVESLYSQRVSVVQSPAGDLYRADVDGTLRFAKTFSGSGLWGTITGILSVDPGVDRIEGLEIVSQNETPGLGGRIDESWFKDQFRGERIGAQGIQLVQGSGTGDTNKDNSKLDAITGASRTSQSIQIIVNGEIATFRKLRDEGGLK